MTDAIIEFDGVSKWYGPVIGLNKLTLRLPAGPGPVAVTPPAPPRKAAG